MNFLRNKTFILIIIVAVFVIGGLFWFQNQKGQKAIYYQTPSEAIEQTIKQNLNTEFWPDLFVAVKDDSDAVALGLGRNFADNYVLRWQKADSSFLVFVGFDKTRKTQLNGYVFNVYRKDLTPKGDEVAQIYFNGIPKEGWRHGGPKSEKTSSGEATSELFSVLFKQNSAEVYLRILEISTNIARPGVIPTEQEILANLLSDTKSEKEFIRITLRAQWPSYPRFGILKEVQDLDHSTY